MAKNHGGINADDFANLLFKQLKAAKEGTEPYAKDAGEQVGESFADGIEQGFENAANRIAASSLKINKAFKDLAKRLTNQKDIFSISLGGKNVVLDIDFSDIDINGADFQKKIDEIFEKFKIDNTIEFDSKTIEKQFKDILALHVKYTDKLSQLRNQAPKLTNPTSIKANVQEQLAMIDGLKEIQKVLDQTSGTSISLPHVYSSSTKDLRTIIETLDRVQKGEEKVGKQHDTNVEKIKKENKELKERNKILEEKVGPIEESQVPPARKPRAKSLQQSVEQTIVAEQTELNLTKEELKVEKEKQSSQRSIGTQQEIKSQEELQKQIEDTNRVIKIQKQWLEHIDPVLDDENYKTSSKKEAAEKLKFRTNNLMDFRLHPEEYEWQQMYEEKVEVAQAKAYKEAERQGVAQSRLAKYHTDAVYSYDSNVKKLQEERALHEKILADAEKELEVLQQQLQVEAKIEEVRKPKFKRTIDGEHKKFRMKKSEADQGVQTSIDDIVPKGVEDTTPKVESEAKALDKVGEAADKAAGKKKKFAKANKEVAGSTAPSIEGLLKEADALDEVGEKANATWSTTRPGVKSASLIETSDTLDNFNLPIDYMGEKGQDAVQMFAKLKSEIEEMTGKPVIIDFISDVNDEGQLEAVGATLKYVNEEAGVTVKQFYDIQRNQDGILIATQSHEKATLAAAKAAKSFNTEMQKKLALEQIKTLKGQMGSLELDLTEVRNAANAINDKASLENFNLALRAAKEQAKQLKSELKGQNTLDTIASMERALLTLPSRLDEVKRRLNTLGDAEGADTIDDVLRSINQEYQRFLSSTDSDEKVKLFRSLTSSMVWVNAEMRNLSGQTSEIKKQETAVEKEELAKQKAARESYINWWKTTLAAQDEADAYEKSLLERERKEKEAEERIIAARKKKEAEYEAWWQKALYNQERAPNLKYGKTTANSAQRKLEATEGAVDALGVTNPEVLAKMDVYKSKVNEVLKIRARFESNPHAAEDSSLVRQFQKAAVEAENARRGIKAVIDEEQKMAQMSSDQGFDPVELVPDQITNLKNEMIAQAEATAQGRMELKGWDGDNKKLYYTVTNSKGAVEEMTMALGQGTNRLYQYRTATKETGTLVQQIFKGIKTKAKELLSFVIGGGSVYKVIELLRQGIQHVRDIDLALTELKKVTDETEESYDKFLETAAKTADKVGSTIQKVVSSTADWARLNI